MLFLLVEVLLEVLELLEVLDGNHLNNNSKKLIVAIKEEPVQNQKATQEQCSRDITKKNKMLVLLFGFVSKIWLQKRY